VFKSTLLYVEALPVPQAAERVRLKEESDPSKTEINLKSEEPSEIQFNGIPKFLAVPNTKEALTERARSEPAK
jgi:hypothetical protein